MKDNLIYEERPLHLPVFMRYFTDRMTGRERERGIGTRIRVKMAAKMLVIAWTLMKKKEMFDPGCIN